MYNYFDVIEQDIREYLDDTNTKLTEDNFDNVVDELIATDSVTGNISGSYFCNAYLAREAITDNVYLYCEKGEEVYSEEELGKMFLYNPEQADVVLRCLLVPEVLVSIMDSELEDNEED